MENKALHAGGRAGRFAGDMGLLREDLLELGEAGQAVLLDHAGLAGDQGQAVVDEVLGDAVVGLVDPLHGDLLLEVGDVGQIEQDIVALVALGAAVALEADHLVGQTGQGGLHGDLAGVEGLGDVGAGPYRS